MDKNKYNRVFIKRYIPYIIISLTFLGLLILLPACNNESEIITPAGGENTTVGFFTEGEQDNHSIQITEAKFILRKMTLKGDHDEGECDLKLGPFIISLDPVQRMSVGAIGYIPPGDYDAIKFQVHKPTPGDGVTDPDFVESNHKRYSVVVRGFYNSEPFVYKSKLTVSKTIEFEMNNVTLTSEQAVFITIRLNPYMWFFENGAFLDPENENNHHAIDHNIKQSLRRAFRDMNRDGEPD